MINKLTEEAVHQYESYTKGSFGGTGVDAAILADNRVAYDPYVFSAKAHSLARNMSKVIKSLKMLEIALWGKGRHYVDALPKDIGR